MKDYKKILEGLVNIINNTEKSDIGFANICTFIGENCPELKEYEDERIRGAIIDHLKDSNLTEWAAWLEKKGEQKEKIVDFKAKDWYVSKVDGKIYNAKFMEEPFTNQKRRLEIEKAAMSATGIIEQEEWFIKGAEWSDKNPSCISSEKQGEQKHTIWS